MVASDSYEVWAEHWVEQLGDHYLGFVCLDWVTEDESLGFND